MNSQNRILFGFSLFFIAVLLFSCATTPKFRDAGGKVIPDSIAELGTIPIDGVDTFISLRSSSINNPIILYVPGGPGMPELPIIRHYNARLEERFLVAYWEPPGTCKSYERGIAEEKIKIERLLSDIHEVISYLKNRFGAEKVYLAGHSWGSILVMLYAQKYPEDLFAVIGIGQIVNIVEAEILSYRYTLEQAKKQGNEKAAEELMTVGNPPQYVSMEGDWYQKFLLKWRWSMKFGVMFYGNAGYWDLVRCSINSPEYSLFDMISYNAGRRLSVHALAREMMVIDLNAQAPRIDVPVYFLIGRHDIFRETESFKRYAKSLDSPSKEVIWFEESGHLPYVDEPDRFNETLFRILDETTP